MELILGACPSLGLASLVSSRGSQFLQTLGPWSRDLCSELGSARQELVEPSAHLFPAPTPPPPAPPRAFSSGSIPGLWKSSDEKKGALPASGSPPLPALAYRVRLTGFQALTLPLPSCAILDRLLCLSVPLFAHCQGGYDRTRATELFVSVCLHRALPYCGRGGAWRGSGPEAGGAGGWDLQVEGTPQGLVSPPPQESMHLQSR